MSTFRIQKDKDNPYVMLNKQFLNDVRLSAKAKGILAYLLSLPDDWQIYETEIAKHFTDGIKSINSGIRELIKNGYIVRQQTRQEKGKFGSYEYCVYEVSTATPFSEFGFSANGKTENGKRHTTNNNKLNNNLTNNKEEEEVISAYENSKVSKVTKTEKNKLLELHTKYPKDLILKAIDYMSDHADKPNIAYIRTTLEDWASKGLTTLDEVNKCLEAWENTKQKAKENKQNNIKKQTEVKKEVKVDTFNNYKQREYDFEDLERKLRFGEREG